MIENPILPGFSPDPSIIRVENDYYIATSTFEWWPGVHLFHSVDLKHWEQIPSPIQRRSQANLIGDPTSGGIWAPCLSYCDGIYYLVYTDVKTKKDRFYNNHNYLIYTCDLYGEWSEPIYLNSSGFDPSLFHDTDGKKYIVNMRNGFKGILVQEYDIKEKKLIGEVKNVFKGTSIGYTEGPHLYRLGEWYYLMTAEGGTGYKHCITMARSKSIWGPYEVDPENPMLTSKDEDYTYLQKCGHGDLVNTPLGEWYVVHLCSRPIPSTQQCLLGRETAIQKVYWNKEGWLRLEDGGRFAKREVPEPEGIPNPEAKDCYNIFEDDFEEEELRLEYSTPRVPLNRGSDYLLKNGYLRLFGQESLNSLHHVSLVAYRQRAYEVEVTTKMKFSANVPEQMAGLTYFYDAMNFYLWSKTVDEDGMPVLLLLRSSQGVIEEMCLPITYVDDSIYLKIITNQQGTQAEFWYSIDGENWRQAGNEMSTHILTDEYCRGFTGAHFGMFCHDMIGKRIGADFDYFFYRENKGKAD